MSRDRHTMRAARRTDSAMTTLEWLMIVGAVSGLAALAVVLVAGLVDDTAEGVAGGATTNPAAAQVAAGRSPRRPAGRRAPARDSTPGESGAATTPPAAPGWPFCTAPSRSR
ncbi:MAG: hypothetical protein OXP08_09285 [bacterium]|nr:hypothetical protein [bacterium]